MSDKEKIKEWISANVIEGVEVFDTDLLIEWVDGFVCTVKKLEAENKRLRDAGNDLCHSYGLPDSKRRELAIRKWDELTGRK